MEDGLERRAGSTSAVIGGIFNEPLVWQFLITVHSRVRENLLLIDRVSREKSTDASSVRERILVLANHCSKWDSNDLDREAEKWVRLNSSTVGLYQFTFTQMIREYHRVFPSIRELGIRVPAFPDFVFSLLQAIYADPLVQRGNFSASDHGVTLALVAERLSTTLTDALVVLYFPPPTKELVQANNGYLSADDSSHPLRPQSQAFTQTERK